MAHAAGDGDPVRVLPIYTRLGTPGNQRKRLGLAESAQSEVTGVADELAGRHLQFRHGRGGCRGRERTGDRLL